MDDNETSPSFDVESLRLPLTVRIGVSGQRTLGDETLIRESLRKVLERLDQILRHTEHTYLGLSSLTEGSDRLLAREVLDWPRHGDVVQSHLHLILPVSTDEYLAECATHASREECRLFLDRASRVEVVEPAATREEVCEGIGHAIVQTCDVLVVIWNGEPARSRGGTAEMVKYARIVGRSLFWIDSVTGKINEERHGDGILEAFEYLDSFNAEPIDARRVAQHCRECYERFTLKARKWGLDPDILKPLGATLLPHFSAVHLLKRKYERRYTLAGGAVYALAAAAVTTVTIQILFFPEYPWIIWLEVVEMAIILFLLLASRAGDWHHKWIDYRFLSERLRTALFLSLFCVTVERPELPPHLSLSHSPNDWLNTAFEQILEKRPLEYCSLDLPFLPLKNFLLSAWIDEQIAFYTRNSVWNARRFELFSFAGEALFTLTLIMAAIHAMGLEFVSLLGTVHIGNGIAALTIIFPAAAGAIGAIRIKKEYLRNSERYAHMVRHLSVIGSQIKRAKDPPTLIKVLREANEVTLREQQDWRVVFRFREIETP